MRIALAILIVLAAPACAQPAAPRASALRYEMPELKQYLPQRPPEVAVLAPDMPKRQAVLQRATDLLGTPYVWGGNSAEGLDCSAYVSVAWVIGRQTTDTLLYVATVIGSTPAILVTGGLASVILGPVFWAMTGRLLRAT